MEVQKKGKRDIDVKRKMNVGKRNRKWQKTTDSRGAGIGILKSILYKMLTLLNLKLKCFQALGIQCIGWL